MGNSNSGSIKNSYSLCTVINSATSGNVSTGGLVGTLKYNSAEISNSFSSGEVSSSYYTTGGLVGTFSSFSGNVCKISNSYSTSNVTGLTYVGGLIGSLGQDTNVSNTYSTGIVTATIASGPRIGGLIGNISTTNASVSNSFWDTENSGIGTSNGGLGKTTTEMKDQTTFTTSAWDFSTGINNWSLQSGSYESYPYLQTFTYDLPGAAPALNPIPGLRLLTTSAPTSISGTTSVCPGTSTTLISTGGSTSADAVDVWYEGACGGDAFYEGWDTQPTSTWQTAINSNSKGILNLTSTGGDPQIDMFSRGSYNPTVYKYINFRYRVVNGTAGSAQFFFLNGSMIAADGSQYLNQALVSDNQWHMVSVDMSANALWAAGGNITGIRYDYATESGVTMDLDFIELSSAPIVGTGSSITVAPSAMTTYYVNRKEYNINTACISQLVTVNPLPVPTFSAQPADLVINSDVSYTTESGQSNYNWTIPGNLNTDYSITSGGTTADNTLVLKWLTTGQKTVSINYTNVNNCTGTIATSSNSITVRNNGISVNGSKISNPVFSIDSNGKIGSGKSISTYGELMNTPVPPKIGDFYQGGIVFYTSIDGSGVTHGLIASTADLAKATWADRLTAAAAYTGGGYSDWRLPSTTELGYLYAKRNISGLAGTFQTSSAAYFYWASNDRAGDYGTGYSFNSGGVVSGGKVYSQSIRPIRSF